ncbi:MAG: cytochrome c, partial [Campylobacterales bacterium]
MWYITTLPESADVLLELYLPSILQTRIALIIAFTLYFLVAIFKPQFIKRSLAIVMLAVIAVVGLWPGEKLRESMRKPYVAGRYIYSNQVIGRDVPGKGIKSEVGIIAANGMLKVNPWIPDRLRTITPENKLEAGHLLTKIACSNCHGLEPDAKFRPLMDKFAGQDAATIKAFMQGALATGSIP